MPLRCRSVTANGFDRNDLSVARGAGETSTVSEIFRHVTVALSRHVWRMRQEALPVPDEVEELAAFLMHVARVRPTSTLPENDEGIHCVRAQDRLLVTKGEAAERLGVSVRTVERLVATGRLPQVHVERLARFRVKDLETYVDCLD